MKRGEEVERVGLVAGKQSEDEEALIEEQQEEQEREEHEDTEKLGRKEERTPLPKMKMFVIMTMLFCEAVSTMQIFPYVAFMVKDFFHYTDDQNKLIGYKAGYLASCFTLGQFSSSFLWGWLADKWGRRPVLLLGSSGTLLAILLFGTSTTFYWALAMRTLHGMLNGNIGVTKTYLAEITDTSNRAVAFSAIGLVSGLARIAGPIIGGFLAQPAVKYPAVFPKGSFFDHFPYLMPCLVGAVITFIGLLAGFFFLTETLHKPSRGKEVDEKDIEMELITKRETSDRNEEDSPRTPNEQDSDEEESLAVKRKGLPEARDNPSNVQPTEPTLLATLLHRKVAVSCVLYFFLALIFISWEELFSLWSVQRVEDGGLGFSTENIGTTAAIAGLIMAVFQMGVYPKMANRWGNLLMFQVSMVFIVPVIIAFPNLNYIPRHFPDKPWLLWVCLVSCVGLRYMSSVSSFTSLTILISNSAPTSKLGAVNGLGQSLGSLGRAVGPAVAGTTFAWSLSNGLGFPFDFRMDYIILALLSLICAVISILMPRTINVTFAEAEQEEAYQKRAR